MSDQLVFWIEVGTGVAAGIALLLMLLLSLWTPPADDKSPKRLRR